jgi:hypothetical protein
MLLRQVEAADLIVVAILDVQRYRSTFSMTSRWLGAGFSG